MTAGQIGFKIEIIVEPDDELIKHKEPIPLGILDRERAHTVSQEPKYKTSYEEDIAVAV